MDAANAVEAPPTDDEEDDEAATDADKKKETPKVRIQRERAELLEKANKGEVKANGFYLFYNVFMFISGLALFCAVIAFGFLIYTIVQMVKGSNN